MLLGLLTATGSRARATAAGRTAPRRRGPGGEAVTDRFYLRAPAAAGDGSITARVTSLTGAPIAPTRPDRPSRPRAVGQGRAHHQGRAPTQGSAYAAVMVTGGHGVRMQYDYIARHGRRPARSRDAPRWLRLTRSGDTVTGYESADGTPGPRSAPCRLAGLPSTVQAGLFVASPEHEVTTQGLGGASTHRRADRRPPRRSTTSASQGDAVGRRVDARRGRRRRHAAACRTGRRGPRVRRHVHRHRIGRHRAGRRPGPAATPSSRACVGAFAGADRA